jgi:hypothetical protein
VNIREAFLHDPVNSDFQVPEQIYINDYAGPFSKAIDKPMKCGTETDLVQDGRVQQVGGFVLALDFRRKIVDFFPPHQSFLHVGQDSILDIECGSVLPDAFLRRISKEL